MTSSTDYVHEGNNLGTNISIVADILILHHITDITIYTASSVHGCLTCKYLIKKKQRLNFNAVRYVAAHTTTLQLNIHTYIYVHEEVQVGGKPNLIISNERL